MFKQRKYKRFNYKPRHLNDKDNNEPSLEDQWQHVRSSGKRKKNIFTSLPFLVLFLIAVIVLFYILSRY